MVRLSAAVGRMLSMLAVQQEGTAEGHRVVHRGPFLAPFLPKLWPLCVHVEKANYLLSSVGSHLL